MLLTPDSERSVQVETEDGVYLTKLVPQVQQCLGLRGKITLLWLNAGGETIPLVSQRDFDLFASSEWCTMPWVLYVHEDASQSALALHDMARALFDRFDVNSNGRIEIGELRRMLKTVSNDVKIAIQTISK